MIDDITFYGAYFFFEIPSEPNGNIVALEAVSSYFVFKLTNPERVSIL
jgi:hypothetical protein